jgi:hypothetical protein
MIIQNQFVLVEEGIPRGRHEALQENPDNCKADTPSKPKETQTNWYMEHRAMYQTGITDYSGPL